LSHDKGQHGKEDRGKKRVLARADGEQESSGMSVQQFCAEQGLTEQSFYLWRKRLRKEQPVRFALVETAARPQPATEPGLELVLTTGERLRIGAGVDFTAVRKVLEALRT
jgi:transposase-like protein